MNGLSPEQVAAYERDGFLFPFTACSADRAGKLRRELEDIERSIGDDTTLMQCLKGGGNLVVPLIDRITRDPVITDKVASLLGPDLLVWGVSLFVKEPRTTDFVSWHQDLHYWGLNDTAGEVTAWLALSPATRDSGCMKFVAGSHRTKVPHVDTDDASNMLSRGQELAVEVDEDDAVLVELRPGEFSLHHGLLFHGSNPNRSDDRRIGIAIRYISTRMAQEGDVKTAATLVRGEDRYGHFDIFPSPTGVMVPSEVARQREALRKKNEINYRGSSRPVP